MPPGRKPIVEAARFPQPSATNVIRRRMLRVRKRARSRIAVVLEQQFGRQPRPVPLRDDLGEGRGLGLCLLVTEQFLDRGLNLPGGVFGFRDADREAEAFETGEIGDLLQLHADTNNGPPRKRGSHDRPDTSVNDGKVRHSVDLGRRDPIGDEHVRRNADSGDLLQLKLHRRDHAVGFAFKAFKDSGDDLGRPGTSHREIDQGLVPRDGGEFRGQGEFFLGNERACEIVFRRQLDAGKLLRLRDECYIAAPELKD